jgi:uncharacterized protein YegP (UPF0339 family)
LDDRYELATAGYGRFCFNRNAGNSQVNGTSRMRAAEGGWAVGLVSVKANWPSTGVREA